MNKSNEFFFVIDNTEYPQALDDPQWKMPKDFQDVNKDLFVKIEHEIYYTSNDKYYAWTIVYLMIISALGFLLLVSMITYFRMVYVYRKHAGQRKIQKQELMKIKANEYERFLI